MTPCQWHGDVQNIKEQAQLPIKSRASAMHFAVAVKLLQLAAACTLHGAAD